MPKQVLIIKLCAGTVQAYDNTGPKMLDGQGVPTYRRLEGLTDLVGSTTFIDVRGIQVTVTTTVRFAGEFALSGDESSYPAAGPQSSVYHGRLDIETLVAQQRSRWDRLVPGWRRETRSDSFTRQLKTKLTLDYLLTDPDGTIFGKAEITSAPPKGALPAGLPLSQATESIAFFSSAPVQPGPAATFTVRNASYVLTYSY
jgi:hypothetical protein